MHFFLSKLRLIQYILDKRVDDGGWNLILSSPVNDPDMTGMAIQALAPYYDTNPEVKEAIDGALETLSNTQHENGGFSSTDGICSESCAQVIVALTTLGINPETKLSADTSTPLSGKKLVITGTLATMGRNQAVQLVINAGGRVADSVSKETDYLVIGEKPGGNKTSRAKELGITILTEDEFVALVNSVPAVMEVTHVEEVPPTSLERKPVQQELF